jgi:hypothetical protein
VRPVKGARHPASLEARAARAAAAAEEEEEEAVS